MFILPFLIGLVLHDQRPEPLRALESDSADPDLGASAPAGRERCTAGRPEFGLQASRQKCFKP
ncbi:hypothetical protein IPC483_23065 [Pseudomonas aeruginosa]|nr:hypothetical protein IPC483_23065 [Pseudomonas aeruginosa]